MHVAPFFIVHPQERANHRKKEKRLRWVALARIRNIRHRSILFDSSVLSRMLRRA